MRGRHSPTAALYEPWGMDIYMLDTFKQLIANQFDAALCTLNKCIHECPEEMWNKPVGSYPFSQAAFHTLFFADYYLEQREETFRDQLFHHANRNFFGDYEQLQPRDPVSVYEKAALKSYLQFCRDKAATAIAAETAETLQARAGFERRAFSRAELYVYNIRHIQHHAAQLSLRLRINAQVVIPWFGSGWRDA